MIDGVPILMTDIMKESNVCAWIQDQHKASMSAYHVTIECTHAVRIEVVCDENAVNIARILYVLSLDTPFDGCVLSTINSEALSPARHQTPYGTLLPRTVPSINPHVRSRHE